MTKRALVLGGGGFVGIAWESGVLHGLREAGVDVRTADLIVGTSAGSVVGTQLALGLPLDTLIAAQVADPAFAAPVINVERLAALTAMVAAHGDVTPTQLQAIGQLALDSPVEDEAMYVQRYAVLDQVPWPAQPLQLTAIDAESGEFQVWERSAGVPLKLAVASSCAVPTIFPPVTINGRRFMDGGFRSPTNADLVDDADMVLIIAPVPGTAVGHLPTRLDHEVVRLRAGGAQVEVIIPDAQSMASDGLNLMDPAQSGDAARVGIRQGLAAAGALSATWR